jgi:hypothetical protein
MTQVFRALPADEGRLAIALRDGGYSVPVAIADLMDNSIAAGANSISVTVVAGPAGHTVYIADNGRGMASKGLEDALRYGSMAKATQADGHNLNKYGIGLKAAGTSIGKTLTVVSRETGSTACALQLSVDQIEANKKFGVIDLDAPADLVRKIDAIAGNHKSGTCIEISDCDRLGQALAQAENSKTDFEKQMLAGISEHLSIVFSDYLVAGLTIEFNGDTLSAPELFPAKHRVGKGHTYKINGEKISVQAYLLPVAEEIPMAERQLYRISNTHDRMNLQGVFVFRGGRAMVRGGWLDMRSKHSDIYGVRFKVSFEPGPLDEILNMDFKKSRVDLPNEIEHQITEEAARYRVEFNKALTKLRAEKKVDRDDIGHGASNRFIESNAPDIQRVHIVKDDGGSQVEVKGPWMPGPYTIEIDEVERNDQGPRVIKVSELSSDALWEPKLALQDSNVRDMAVALNTSHEFYAKTWQILESAGQANAVRILDLVFFGLAQAEWCGGTDQERATLKHWRLEVSRYLESVGEKLPKGLTDESSDDV